jgi:uncharacterized protein YutE (UPF0331/DUF86 family)
MKDGQTLIQISVSTKKELVALGKKPESYDDIIKKLIATHRLHVLHNKIVDNRA